ncbi:epidermal growth factor receptor kinase substrate 8-like protein 3b [Cyprinodon tularosa]|uniref:epidermal growth factor receptor kinase substrate 8-like protein 3b n=1 Tax=Cyprinodon tularosa TaxID=77115 RepID=UPI0018E1EE5E|nr:epidermal growth factor receptor kinase substrate 8-like protein 3b [Cyprinodon tularosa]
MFGNSRPFSYSGGFNSDDYSQRRGFSQDEPKESLFQRNSMSRPSGRSIYMQRKEYSETLNRNSESFQVRVEHLFICDIDGQEVRSEEDCVAKLKRLDGKGRLWPQEMYLEIKGAYLVLCDIETKAELDSIPLMGIKKTSAVLDSCAYNSLLTLTVQEPVKRLPQVFMFQCEETGADVIKADLDKILQRVGDIDPRRVTPDFSRENSRSLRQNGPRPFQQDSNLPPPDYVGPQRQNSQQDYMPDPRPYSPQEEMSHYSDNRDADMAFQQAEIARSTEIFNHIIADLEFFIGKVTQALNEPQQKSQKSKKMISMKKKSKSNAAAPPLNLPHWQEYASYLQKIKYGFNLLAQLNGALSNPSAAEYVHFFFNYLDLTFRHYPPDLPSSIVSPLLTQEAVEMLHQVLSPQEQQLWQALGECWAIPRSEWPDNNVPPYIPDFYDGWQLPAPLHPPPAPRQNHPLSRNNSQRFPPGGPGDPMGNGQGFSPRAVLRRPEEPMSNGPISSPPPRRPTEPPLYMRVMYNFSARNSQELSVMQGEMVQVIQKSRPWWVVRNNRNEEGSIPPNILEPIDNEPSMDDQEWDSRGHVTLNYNSSPADVKAWLEYKGFSKITVSSLGVLTGRLLLGMSKEEIRTVCPEEAGKVAFQLQSVKSSLALSDEPSQMYNSRY